MTERKSLKARVRARMAQTGESYTTAHRQVVSRRPAPPGQAGQDGQDGLVPGYRVEGETRHRPSALTARLLTQSGVEVDELLACGLGGGIGFLYAVFEYRQVDHPLLTVVAQHHPTPWLEAAATHLGVTLDSQHSTSTRAALTKLDAVVTAGRAAELLVSRADMPGHTGVDAMEASEPHPVVVAGIRGEKLLVEDRPGQITAIDREILGQAWAAHRKGRHQLTTVATVPAPVDLPVAVRRALRTTVDHLTGPVVGNAYDVNFGLSGMAKLAAELRDGRTKAGWARRFGDPAHLGYAVGRLADCLTTSYTAPGATRPMYADFLARAAGELAAPRLEKAAGLISGSGRAWTALALLARDAAERPESVDASPLFAELAELVDEAVTLETRAVTALRGWLDG